MSRTNANYNDTYMGGHLYEGIVAKEKRKERSMNERIYCMNVELSNDCCNFYVSIQGQTGNTYAVSGEAKTGSKFEITCQCKDFERRQQKCKHIYFVMYKVLGLPGTTSSVCVRDMKGYKERSVAIAASVSTEDATTSHDSKRAKLADDNNKQIAKRQEYIDEDCAICFDTMQKDEDLNWCQIQCGKSFHTDCLRRWVSHKPNDPVCPLCRATIDVCE